MAHSMLMFALSDPVSLITFQEELQGETEEEDLTGEYSFVFYLTIYACFLNLTSVLERTLSTALLCAFMHY